MSAPVVPYDYWHWYDIRIWLLQRDGVCHYCRRPLDKLTITIDHYIPKTKGGTDDIGNLVASCRECNQEKGGQTPEEFLIQKSIGET